ncbi:hypothetical protein C1M53_27605 [Mesorhizobium sp. Pch-S]|nr:hypothetical protein C1M53_27605 [Mesorhizobium sp. Pch-S]
MRVKDVRPADLIREAGHLQRLEIKPGERFVLTCDYALSEADADRVRQAWDAFMGDVPLLVLTDGISLGAVSHPEPVEAEPAA